MNEDELPVPVGGRLKPGVGRLRPKLATFTHTDLVYAYECAAGFLESEEWTEDDGGAQVAAYQEAARRIRHRADVLARQKPPSTTYSGQPMLGANGGDDGQSRK